MRFTDLRFLGRRAMSTTTLLVVTVLSAFAARTNGPALAAMRPTDDAVQPFAVKAARIWTADRDAVLTDSWIEIADGRIVRIGNGPVPSDLDVVDFGDAEIVPGLVSANASTSLGNTGRFGARYVSGDNLDTWAFYGNELKNGITTARLAVGNAAFVGGIASVVKFGREGENQVLSRFADLTINFNDAGGRNAPEDGEITYPSSSDVPMVKGTIVRPATKLGRIAAFRALFEAADEYASRRDKSWKDAGDLDLRLDDLNEFSRTKRPVRIDARRVLDVRQAVAALKGTGRAGYIYGATEAALAVSDVQGSNYAVVYEADTDLGAPGSDSLDLVKPLRHDATTPAKLLRAGVRVALAAKDGDLLLAAARSAGSGGLSPHEALQAITLWPAILLGVGDRVGSLTPGKDADFAVLNGSPTSSRTHVVETWIGGKRVFTHSERSGDAVVIRAGRVYDGKGGVIENGEVLIEGGKITAVGTQVPRPVHARVVDGGPRAVATPGFIDLHGHSGLGNDRTRLAPGMSLAPLFAVTRPDLWELAKTGVTTVVVAPRDADPQGAQATAVKTFGSGPENVVAKELAAIKLACGRDGESTTKSLDGLFKRAKAYDDQWKKYEDELAKWKAAQSGGAAAAAPAAEAKPADAKPEEPKKDDPITGTWEATLKGPMLPEPEKGILKLRLNDDNTITGTTSSPIDPDGEELGVKGRLDGKTVTLELQLPEGPTPIPIGNPTITATLDGPDHMAGKLDVGGMLTLDFEASRTEKGAPVIKVSRTKKKEDGPGPKKPKSEPALEPYRALFAGKAGLLLTATSPTQVRAALAVLAGYGVRPTFVFSDDGPLELLDELRGGANVALSTLRITGAIKRRPIVVAHEYARAGVAIGFHSSAGVAAAEMPDQIRAAVHEGFGAEAALSALTFDAAKALRMDDVVGSLSRGCDGDVLLFDGEPFEASTRLVRSFVKGREVTR